MTDVPRVNTVKQHLSSVWPCSRVCAQFYDKFQHRESVMEVMEYVWTIPAHKARFVEVLSDTVRAFA